MQVECGSDEGRRLRRLLIDPLMNEAGRAQNHGRRQTQTREERVRQLARQRQQIGIDQGFERLVAIGIREAEQLVKESTGIRRETYLGAVALHRLLLTSDERNAKRLQTDARRLVPARSAARRAGNQYESTCIA